MAEGIRKRSGETTAHLRLKRLALVWAQAHGYSACAMEVSLPHCRYRADIAACREDDRTAVFECKQSGPDFKRDDCNSENTRSQLNAMERRLETIERNLRVHYPTLRTGESLFPDYDPFDFSTLAHRGHTRATRKSDTLRRRLFDCTKFEKLARYHCANLLYLVVPEALQSMALDCSGGWGVLVANGETLTLQRKPLWHDVAHENQQRFLGRVAAAATRALNRELEITRDEIEAARPVSF